MQWAGLKGGSIHCPSQRLWVHAVADGKALHT